MRILIIEEDIICMNALARYLANAMGHDVLMETNVEKAYKLYDEHPFPIVISGVLLPGGGGISLLRKIKSHPFGEGTEVILMTAYSKINYCIEALRSKAFDFFLKPIDIREMAKSIENAERSLQLKADKNEKYHKLSNRESLKSEEKKQLLSLPDIGEVIFYSKEMCRIRDFCFQLHKHSDIPVMIEGETGTGKEVIARLIHYGMDNDVKEQMPFISINCSAISANLFESELFGYEKGAFTGADSNGKVGKLELANGGSLFLDEIGDMPLDFQPKLLRVLQEKEFYRVGGNQKKAFNARVICATNSNLLELIEKGKFRSDLYYRLDTAKILIPPLRERKKDILPMTTLILKKLNKGKENKFTLISVSAKELLEKLSWRGNVRELNSVLNRIYLQYKARTLLTTHIESIVDEANRVSRNEFIIELPEEGIALSKVIKMFIRKALRFNNNNVTRTANYLEISRNRVKRILDI